MGDLDLDLSVAKSGSVMFSVREYVNMRVYVCVCV